MIKNSKQAAITRAKLEGLKKDLVNFEQTQKEAFHPVRFQLGVKAFQGLITDLSNQLDDYERLTKAAVNEFEGYSLRDLAKLLIGARLAQNLSQKDLGDKLGIQEQQIQRYEQDDYTKASWGRILEVVGALGLNISMEKFKVRRDTQTEAAAMSRKWRRPDHITRESVDLGKRKTINRGALFGKIAA
jgi:HTH-type transcriptional regulator/antitoxin HipB